MPRTSPQEAGDLTPAHRGRVLLPPLEGDSWGSQGQATVGEEVGEGQQMGKVFSVMAG